jgi:predicted nuclease of predicted toxin-antitoxin system
LRFLLDQNLPVRLCALLRQLGHEALHVEGLGLGEATDAEVWAEARRRDAVMVSKDSDFLALAARDGRLVRLRIGNRSNRDLFDIIARNWPEVVERLDSGERIVELRG